jgi:hypothetical protein
MKKSIIEKIRAIFEEEQEEMVYMDIKTADGKILRVTEMVIGGLVKELTEDGEVDIEGEVEFTTEEGFTVMVKDGVIEDIKEPVVEELEEDKKEEEVEEEVKVEMANVMRNDGVAIYYQGPELVVGETTLWLDEAMTEPAPEGEHILEGGIKVTIVDGVLAEMVEIEVEEEATENAFESEMFNILNSIKAELDSIKAENKKLSERFNKFASEPSDEPTNTKVDFAQLNKAQMRDEKLKFFGKR